MGSVCAWWPWDPGEQESAVPESQRGGGVQVSHAHAYALSVALMRGVGWVCGGIRAMLAVSAVLPAWSPLPHSLRPTRVAEVSTCLQQWSRVNMDYLIHIDYAQGSASGAATLVATAPYTWPLWLRRCASTSAAGHIFSRGRMHCVTRTKPRRLFSTARALWQMQQKGGG